MKKAIVIGGSRGIGKAIAAALKSAGCNVVARSKKDIDTSDLHSVKKFMKKHKQTDIIVLNTGGPPPKSFFEVKLEEWERYHRQLFLGFCLILQEIKIRDGGYVFVITSSVIKEPNPNLVISVAYRLAFTGVLKSISKNFASRNISCINIAPGIIDTDRALQLNSNLDSIAKSLPMGRIGKPEEIGNFVRSIIEKNIKYLSGIVVNFDGAASNYVL